IHFVIWINGLWRDCITRCVGIHDEMLISRQWLGGVMLQVVLRQRAYHLSLLEQVISHKVWFKESARRRLKAIF
ncbi:hypothetical protein BUE93_04765, partial [Chromobacterium amazonense]